MENGKPLRVTKGNRLAIEKVELEDGAEIEVLWQGHWMRGRLEYVWWRHCHRLWCESCSIDLRAGMLARQGKLEICPTG